MATHTFVPDRWYTTLAPHPPALRVADGDTVVTVTLDARGADEQGAIRAGRPNPMTGPIFVEGAEPGDALLVRLDRLEPNRPTGWTRDVLADTVVDPDALRDLPPSGIAEWAIDAAAGAARLLAPPPRLERLVLPLEPMLGCFGVAPAGGEAISTASSGPHGGNMDYRGFRANAQVAFPVAVPGALFFLGDGHAAQGDGEIVGTGIETSFATTVTLRVQRGRTINWPRGEDAAGIFTVGNARPLDQALQHATTEMLRWLGEEFGLDPRAASLLLGQTVRYDVANVYNPAFSVVCRLPHEVLALVSKS